MAQYNVNNIMVSSLLSSIRDGTIAIPEIQRPFVWDPTKVRDLIDSLYKGYPVGYIIVWQNPDVKLKDGTISSGKKIIIDGQQRITALTAAIVGLEVVGADYKKKRIKIAFNPKEERFETCNPAIEKDIQWISDISTVLQPGFDAFSFVNEYCDKNKITDNAEKSSINKVINTLSQIQNNSLGVIDLSYGLDIDSVTDIFIRINSKGKVLSQADFAMSKIQCEDKKPVYGGIVDINELMLNLKANCVPEDFVKMDVKDFNRFLDERRKLMAAKIKEYYESLK